jgi:hypothetical protein
VRFMLFMRLPSTTATERLKDNSMVTYWPAPIAC